MLSLRVEKIPGWSGGVGSRAHRLLEPGVPSPEGVLEAAARGVVQNQHRLRLGQASSPSGLEMAGQKGRFADALVGQKPVGGLGVGLLAQSWQTRGVLSPTPVDNGSSR
ncbi:MAG: hypothetical protein JO069_04035, partial [Verrucomicrobia bacterium]|nr:hypothetical protein [Verrucomicrobiota bacterium]